MKVLKISKKTGLVIAIGIFVIALAGLFMVYSGRAGEQRELDEQLASLQARLSGVQLAPLSSRQAELEEQLSQPAPQLGTAKAILSQPIGSVNVTRVLLLGLAKDYGVVVTEITSPGLTTENLEGVTFSVLPLTTRVEGKVPNLVAFITRLNNYFTTGAVKSVTITVLEAASSDNASADIQLVVYSYQGG